MTISTLVDDDAARSASPKTDRASLMPFILGISISVLLWAVLGVATTIC